MRNKRNATIAAVISAVVLIVCGWLLLRGGTSLETFPLNTLKPQGDKAQIIFDLVLWVFGIAALVFLLVEVGVIWMIYRFRQDPRDSSTEAPEGELEPVQLHGNPSLEIAWTIVPALLLAVLAVFNVQGILRVDDVADDALEVTVVGQQWWWEYRYDTDDDGVVDIITANQLVMPAGRDVELSIQSNDVIHSFWIPALNGKKDAVPGRTHSLVLQAWEPGIYQGQCTEFCGLSHGVMRMQVKALSADDYAEWIDKMTTPPAQPDTELAKAGQELFVQQCASCHQVNGVEPGATTVEYAELPDPDYGETVDSPLLSKNAPNLTHLMMRDTFAGSLLDLYEEPATPVVENPSTPNTNNLKRWLRNPEDIKPMDPANGQGMPNLGLSEEQIDQLVAYLTTLK
jgi:cytochrome c oxidase subunit 2